MNLLTDSASNSKSMLPEIVYVRSSPNHYGLYIGRICVSDNLMESYDIGKVCSIICIDLQDHFEIECVYELMS